MSNVDEREIRVILADLQEEIRRHRLMLGETEAAPISDPITRVRERQMVNPHVPIGWPVMPPGIVPKLTSYLQKITRRLLRWYINPIVAQQNEYNAAATELFVSLEGRVSECAQRLRVYDGEQQSFVTRLAQRQDVLDAGLAQLQRRAEAEQETIGLRLQRLETRHTEPEVSTVTPAAPLANSAIDYFLLGALYRNRLQMADRLGDYDDLFRPLVGAMETSQAASLPVLDIGCGRGEYVSHLTSLGLPAYGVDLDDDAIAIGQTQGLDLRQADVFTHLQGLPDNSLAAVIMIQVIEHFEPEALLRLLQLITRKLRPGGFVVAETINPACLHALSNWYLMDPSHRTPMHSETTRFLMMQAGLRRIEVRFLHPVPENEQLQNVFFGGESRDTALAMMAAQIQRNTEQLNRILYGPQDYAAIAYKLEN